MNAPAIQNIDPVRRELIKNALVTIADNMIASVIRTSRSIVVKNNLDFSSSILDADGRMVAQGLSLPGHLGATEPAFRGCIDYFGDDISEGDILCSNDPYAGGSHLNDVFMFRPIFHEGSIVAYAAVIIHHTDVGGRVPGGNAPDSTEIYQEGLRIPPSKIWEKGVPNKTLFRIIENNVRVSDKVIGDFHAQIACLLAAEAEFSRVIKEYGAETLSVYMDDLIEYAEKLTRLGIAALPDGVGEFEDWIDDNGTGGDPVRLKVRLEIKGDEVRIDFTGTSPQTSGAINPNRAFTVGLALAVLRTVLDPNIPPNSGFNRAIDVFTPEGSFVNPSFPAPLGARGLAGYRVRHVVLGALAQIVPDMVAACVGGSEFAMIVSGYKPDGKQFLSLELHNITGTGGGPDKDGQDGGPWCLGNLSNVPVEILESEGPLLVERYEFLPETEGAGKYRGALGIVREYRLLAEDSLVQVRSDRQAHPPYGLFGGQPGAPGRIVLNPGAGETVLPSKMMRRMKAGDVLRAEMPGGGGYGDPMLRDPQAVLKDVVHEKMSIARAREVYGVVVDAAAMAIDEAATAALRGS